MPRNLSKNSFTRAAKKRSLSTPRANQLRPLGKRPRRRRRRLSPHRNPDRNPLPRRRSCSPANSERPHLRRRGGANLDGLDRATRNLSAARRGSRSACHATTHRAASILLDQFHGALEAALRQIVAHLDSADAQSAAKELEPLLARAPLGMHLAHPWHIVIAGPAQCRQKQFAKRDTGLPAGNRLRPAGHHP